MKTMRGDGLMEPLEARTLLAAVSWDGGGDATSLADPFNWSTNQVPGAADNVVINDPGNPVISAAQGTFTFHSLTCFEAVAFGFGGAFSLTLAADSAFKGDAQVSGVISGAGSVSFQGHSDWKELTFETDGRVIVGADGTAVVEIGVNLKRRLDNQGLIQVNATLFVSAGVHVNNLPGGLISLGADIVGQGPQFGTFNNAGTLVMSAASGFVEIDDLVILSTGTIVVNEGRLSLNGSGTLNVISGEVFVAKPGTLELSGEAVLTLSSRVWGQGALISKSDVECDGTIDGLGTLDVEAHTLTLNGPTKVKTLDMNQGVLAGTADVLVLHLLSWIGGSMAGSGRTIVTKGAVGVMRLVGEDSPLLQRRLTNNGLIQIGGLLVLDGGIFENNPGAELDGKSFSGAKDAEMIGAGAGGTLLNKGIINLAQLDPAASLRLTRSGADMRFTNNGTLDVDHAHAVFLGTVTQVSGTTLTGGTWITRGLLDLPANIRTNKAVVTLDGVFASFPALSGLKSNQGSLTVRLGAVLVTVPQGGVFTNTGTLKVGLGAELQVIGGFTQTAQGTTVIRISGTTEDDFGRIIATGAATLAGAARFEFVNGFAPSAGQKFIFLTAASRIGNFGSVSSLGLPAGLKIALVHFNKGVRIDVLPV